MAIPMVSQVLKEVDEMKTKKERIEHLRYHRQNKVMLELLKYAFDPKIKFSLPEGAPPYKKDQVLADTESGLYSRFRSFYIFLEGGSPGLTNARREKLFIELLESINEKEAELLICVKDKKLPYKQIDAKLVKEAFPGLIG